MSTDLDIRVRQNPDTETNVLWDYELTYYPDKGNKVSVKIGGSGYLAERLSHALEAMYGMASKKANDKSERL